MTALPGDLHLRKLPLDLPLAAHEAVSCITAFNSNLYIGTSAGNLLHLYLFDDADEYILILQTSVAEKAPVAKIMVLPDVELCLVLANNVIHLYTLPELSPCRISKIKDANDMLELSQVKTAKKAKRDKIIVYTPTKLRLVQFLNDTVKLLKDINYAGALLGLSPAAGTLANYSNICLVANDTNYDVVDLQQTRRISLFEFNPDKVEAVVPHIVPYSALDKEHSEEYVLTICSDAATSMAMFINSVGDVTRGTLTWIDEGYPTNGVVVEWPYVIGLFTSGPDSEVRLTFSSLENLTVEYSAPLANSFTDDAAPPNLRNMTVSALSEYGLKAVDQDLLAFLTPVNVATRESRPHEKQFSSNRVVFFESSSVYYMCLESDLVKLIRTTLQLVEKSTDAELEDTMLKLKDIPHAYASGAYLLLLLIFGKIEEAKDYIRDLHTRSNKADPRLLLLLFDGYPGDDAFWGDFYAEAFLLKIIDTYNGNTETSINSKEFPSWLINEIFVNRDHYGDAVQSHFRKMAYTVPTQGTAQILAMVDMEKEVWQGQNAVNDDLIAFFEKNDQLFVLIHIYLMRLTIGNHFRPWATLIIDLALQLLSREKNLNGDNDIKLENGVVQFETYKFDLVDVVFTQLTENVDDSDQYAKKLLELLQLYPERGLELLQGVKGNKFKSTHKFILDELSKSYDINARFSSLKIEYIEHSFMEKLASEKAVDPALARELLVELLQYVDRGDFAAEFENLTILLMAFKLDNDLADATWPKISWADFLHVNRNKSQCKELITVYLKVYELLLIRSLNHEPIEETLGTDNEAMAYLARVFGTEETDKIEYLIKVGDYSAAEWMAVSGSMPLPSRPVLLDPVREHIEQQYVMKPVEEGKQRVKQLVDHYLNLEDSMARNLSVRHMIDLYGKKYFGFVEVLGLLPESFPILYIQEFLVDALIEVNERKTDLVMQKMLTRQDAKFTEKVYKEFNVTLAMHEE